MHTDFVSVCYLIHKNIKMNYFNSTEVKSHTITSEAQFPFTFFVALKDVILEISPSYQSHCHQNEMLGNYLANSRWPLTVCKHGSVA